MKRLSGATTLTVALLLAGCNGGGDGNSNATADPARGPQSVQRIGAPNNGDWTQTVAQTDEGFRMGNPDAPVKLVEYASITCPHCAEFSEQGGARLREYVRTGQVNWEYRPFIIFPTDPGTFALLRCQGAGPFFQLSDQLYATQREWTGRLQALPQEQLSQIEGMPPVERAAFLVRAAGLDQFFRQRGMPEARVNQCLANGQDLQRLAAITQRASEEEHVTGTPTFIINGEKATAGNWAELEPILQQRLPR
jgi:protein-disulfide isomerase